MDASTLFYLSKLAAANSNVHQPAMTPTGPATVPPPFATNDHIHQLLALASHHHQPDPGLFNSMAESYLRRMYSSMDSTPVSSKSINSNSPSSLSTSSTSSSCLGVMEHQSRGPVGSRSPTQSPPSINSSYSHKDGKSANKVTGNGKNAFTNLKF